MATSGRPREAPSHGEQGLTIDALAEAVGMTPRNVRAHQSRGLLHRPTVHGRTGYYDGTHVSRLMLVKELQERGLNLAAIQALLDSREVVNWLFHDMRQRTHEPGDDHGVRLPHVSVDRLLALDPGAPDELVRHGILRREPDDGFSADPVLFAAALHLIERGMPLGEVVAVLLDVGRSARQVAEDLGDALARLVGSRGGGGPRVPRGGTRAVPRPAGGDDLTSLSVYAVQMCVAGFESLLLARVENAATHALGAAPASGWAGSAAPAEPARRVSPPRR